MKNVRRIVLLVLSATGVLFAQGPLTAVYYNPSMDLPWAHCYAYLNGGSRLKLPFLPMVDPQFHTPLGTSHCTRNIDLNGPVVFLGNGVSPGPSKSYSGIRRDGSAGDLDVKGKVVLFACDAGSDTSAEARQGMAPLSIRIGDAALRGAAAVVLFSHHEEYPFLYYKEEDTGTAVPDIPVITVTKTSVLDLLRYGGINPAAWLSGWDSVGRSPQSLELTVAIHLDLDGKFTQIESKHFSFRARRAEFSDSLLHEIARVNEQALAGVFHVFSADTTLTWRKIPVTYYRGYDSKVFYTHHWGLGFGGEHGNILVHEGVVPSLSLAAHENTHTLIDANWKGGNSFLSEGLGRYAEAAVSRTNINDGATLHNLRNHELFPLREMLGFDIGQPGRRTLVGYPAAGSFVGFLIESFGLARLRRIYEIEGQTLDEPTTQAAWKQTYGRSLDELEQDWHSWLLSKR